ncbi:MAG: FAD-binding oxidoreductase [Chlorobi bacterium]|nr:FAD-binding oxidoreductase [Chlorobiota bacterium]MCI0716273.1 FAD-binding oxidoreductase [Chlorobiota bacterium]
MLSFWEKNSLLNYDCIIAGSGILGLSTACEIKENFPGKEVLVLERGIFPTGASTKNAGFLCFGSLTEILADIKFKDEDDAFQLVENRWRGISLLKQRLSENKMGYLKFGGYELIDDKYLNALEKIDYVNELLKDIFDENAFEIKDELIKDFGFNRNFVKSLVYSPYEAQIDTGEMMKTLLKYAQFLGIQIINGCEVKDVYKNKVAAYHNILKEEIEFTSDCTIICTNAFTNKLIPEMNVKPGRGQVLITKPINDLKFKGIFHYDEGYYYFRNYGKRVIFGGGRNLDFEGEETDEFEQNEKIINDLTQKLNEIILPNQKYEIEDTWAGIMGFTENKLPVVQRVSDNIIVAISCNGMGIALSSFIARQIAGLLS